MVGGEGCEGRVLLVVVWVIWLGFMILRRGIIVVVRRHVDMLLSTLKACSGAGFAGCNAAGLKQEKDRLEGTFESLLIWMATPGEE
jgi:hypothetical protein